LAIILEIFGYDHEFDPTSMLITQQLTPIALNEFPAAHLILTQPSSSWISLAESMNDFLLMMEIQSKVIVILQFSHIHAGVRDQS
jgi:hypothetical protein